MKPIFEPSDFSEVLNTGTTTIYRAAYDANAKIQKLIESWDVVYSSHDANKDLFEWSKDKYSGCTHKARLAFIEELPKEPCKHEPVISHIKLGGWLCKHCEVELIASWKEKK